MASPLDLSFGRALEFLRRQYLVVRHYASWWWLAAVLTATFRNVVWLGSLWADRLRAGIRHAVAVDSGRAAGRAVRTGGVSRLAHTGPCWSLFSRSPIVTARGASLRHLGRAVGRHGRVARVAEHSAWGDSVAWRWIRYRFLPGGRIEIVARPRTAPAWKARILPARTGSVYPRQNRRRSRPWATNSPGQARQLNRQFSPNPWPALMHIVLWDTRKSDVSKDFAGGFGIGQYVGDGTFSQPHDSPFLQARTRPTALLFAYLAGIFARLGHRVEYAEDCLPRGADLYVFNPSLLTLQLGTCR